MTKLAAQTGGRAYFPKDSARLDDAYETIRTELSSQHLIAYQSSASLHDGRFRHVHVDVSRLGVEARTRPGYFAPAADSSASRSGGPPH